jgi:phage terminase large subunit GpA-like protein
MIATALDFNSHSLHAARTEFDFLFTHARGHRIRSMLQFAQDEVIIPEGKHNGKRWRRHRQPYGGLLLEAFDSGKWTRHAILGCVQSGKSLHAFVIPTLYHLFELQERVIFAAPTEEMCRVKWQTEIMPFLRRSRYYELFPRRGAGSKDGWAERIEFGNGADVIFMAGRGGDESRSGVTSRVAVITEADKMDKASSTSRESAPVKQIEARLESNDLFERRLYMECTVSIPTGAIWTEYTKGTESRIAVQCPHCLVYTTPEREHVVGWEEAETEKQAIAMAKMFCSACGEMWNDTHRRDMNRSAVLAHRGQTVESDGTVVGPEPESLTLGFRWNGFNNMFWSVGRLGLAEWTAQRAEDQDEAERYQKQFVWAVPVEVEDVEVVRLDREIVAKRVTSHHRGVVPADYPWLTMGIDVGQKFCHWVLVAWKDDATGLIVDYGYFAVDTETMEVDAAIESALVGFLRRTDDIGFPSTDGKTFRTQLVWIDAGHHPKSVLSAVRQIDRDRVYPCLGRGYGQHHVKAYNEPTRSGNIVKHIGERYHFKWLKIEQQFEVEIDADHWKSWAVRRLNSPLGSPGSVELFAAEPHVHNTFVRHLTAEEESTEFDKKRNKEVTKWTRIRRANHYFDAYYLACGAGHFCGVRVLKGEQQEISEERESKAVADAAQAAAKEKKVVPLNWGGVPYFASDRS